jgi:hypothetical protein
MKVFVAHLNDGRALEFEADDYHRDNEQYVFIADDGTKLDWVLASEVVSISEHKKNLGRPGRGW